MIENKQATTTINQLEVLIPVSRKYKIHSNICDNMNI